MLVTKSQCKLYPNWPRKHRKFKTRFEDDNRRLVIADDCLVIGGVNNAEKTIAAKSQSKLAIIGG